MGVVEARYELRVKLDDTLDEQDVGFLKSLVDKELVAADAGISANGTDYKLQGGYIGRMHNAKMCASYTTLTEFQERIAFFKNVSENTVSDQLRLQRIVDYDQHHNCRLTPELIRKLNGSFARGCIAQTSEFYNQVKEHKTLRYLRAYIDARLGDEGLLGPAEHPLNE